MKESYYGLKSVDQFSIPVAICLELVCFILKKSEDGIGGVASLEGLGEGMCGEINIRSFRIIGQGSVEDRLEIGSGGR